MIRRILALSIFAIMASFAPGLLADTVILRSGASHTGTYTAPYGGMIHFTGTHGVKYIFPVRDVQTIVFTSANDTITLRNGHSYTGTLTGGTTVQFSGSEGIQYQFPFADIASLVLSQSSAPVQKLPAEVKQIPSGTEIMVRTEENIDSKNAAPGQTFRADIRQNVLDSAGAVAIPAGSLAALQIKDLSNGGMLHSSKLALDIASVTVNGKTYSTLTADDYVKGGEAVGANKRTAGFIGGGAALGTLVGGIFGGGKGALIGALSGAGAGGATQVLTRGKQITVPAETVMVFYLDKTLVLRPR